ncbi:MAG: S9 family peptidase [Chloroflexi bacterium]|nr:S9 family peptidase [Chloroflexota bacterium]
MINPINPSHVYDLVGVSDPAISPDGERVAFLRSWVERESGGKAEARSQIMMTDASGGEATPFTAGPKDSQPRFSPDGSTIAFLRRDDKKRGQVWLIFTAGGEARQLSELQGGVDDFVWSPDSSLLAAVSDVDPDAKPELDESDHVPKVKVARRIRYREDGGGWRGDAFRQLFVVDAATGESRQLTSTEGDNWSPAWSPDGASVAYVCDAEEGRDIRDVNGAYVVSAAGGEPKRWSDGLVTVVRPAWSPDGLKIAILGSEDPEAVVSNQGWVYVLESGKAPRRLTDDTIKPQAGYGGAASSATQVRWTGDGNLLFVADTRSDSYIYKVSVEDGKATRVAGGTGQWTAAAFDAAGDRAAAVLSSPGSPSDVYSVDLSDGTAKQLTDYNRDYFKDHPAATVERFSVSRGGMDIESRLYLPPNFDPSGLYPLVLTVHGGPHNAYYDDFNTTQQVLATNGYLALAVNPRGSSTYGVDFMKAVQQDWGGEDFLDILAAVDGVVSRPYVDGDRLGITGYSYGGFMSAWAIGQDTRFKAAVVGAPCTDLTTMHGTSDIGVSFGEVEWGGSRHEALEAYLAHSPITYVDRVETPVLLLHGEDDVRCPIGQSEQYFVALKRLGKPVEMVRFPGCSHGFQRSGPPNLREEYLARMLAWFDRYLGAPSP